MRPIGLMLVLTSVALAGCADDDATDDVDDANLGDVDASATTGGIRGVVFDEAVRPIEGATVNIADRTESVLTNRDGAFTISGLPGQEFVVTASHPLYTTVQKTVEVEVGVTDPQPVKFLLERIVDADPYMNTVKERGYISCSANIIVFLSEECGEGVGSPEQTCDLDSLLPCVDNPVMPGERIGKAANNRAQIDFWLEGPNVKSLVVEQIWEPSVNVGVGGGGFNTRLATDWACDPICGGDQHDEADGESPLRLEADTETLEGLNVTQDLRFSTFTWASTEETGLLLEQDFEVFISASYVLPLPEEWSFLNGDEDPWE